jgi:hypothetical protein
MLSWGDPNIMIYVFDSSSFNILKEYYRDKFRTFWTRFDEAVARGEVLSVREVLIELDGRVDRPHLQDWIKTNRGIFLTPSADETMFIQEIFAIPHFQYLMKPKNMLTSAAFADPFVIALAKVRQGCVVTEEKLKKDGAKIPNICKHFGVECTNLEGFIEQQNWEF